MSFRPLVIGLAAALTVLPASAPGAASPTAGPTISNGAPTKAGSTPSKATSTKAGSTTSRTAPTAARQTAGEADVDAAIARAFATAGRRRPAPDPVLGRAAEALARRALRDGPSAATASEAVAEELSRAGGWDPPPRVIVVRASPRERALASLAARQDLGTAAATHYGRGVATEGTLSAAVLLFSDRRAVLEPFPRQVAPGDEATLLGEVVFPLHDPRVFVNGPTGLASTSGAPAGGPRNRIGARIQFPRPGRYTVEVVADSIKGPEVVALFQVQAGKAGAAPPANAEVAERDLEKAEAQVLAAINRRRRAAGLPALARSALLDAVATAHAEEMVRLDYFAHRSPKTGDLGDRLRAAGFAYLRAAENLGEAQTSLDAHRLIEASPGHLANLLDPRIELAGLGTVRVRRGGIENVLLVEVFALPGP